MGVRWPLVLPLGALLAVAVTAAVVFTLRGSEPSPPPAVAPATETPEPPPARIDSGGSVCQGVISRPAPDQPRVFDPSYTKQREVVGIAVVAPEAVSDRALDEAVATIETLFANNDLEGPLAEEGAYVIVLAAGQGVLDLPEFSCLRDELGSDFFDHVCGVADRADYPVATVSELDVTGDPRGPCQGTNILFHELGHLVQGWTLEHADYLDTRLLYQDALNAGKYAGEYASTNANEYFAEGTQAYFTERGRGESRHRQWLERYDPELFKLLQSVYGD